MKRRRKKQHVVREKERKKRVKSSEGNETETDEGGSALPAPVLPPLLQSCQSAEKKVAEVVRKKNCEGSVLPLH